MRRVSTVLSLVILVGGVAAASPIDDFKAAVDKEGCDSIPYSGLRSTCTSKRSEVESWCKSSSRRISCDKLDPTGLNKQISNVKEKIETLKRERDDLSSRISSAKDEEEKEDLEEKRKRVEDEIYKLTKKLEEWERRLADERSLIRDRIYNGERCVGFREQVARSFVDAKSSARSESDPEIKPYAQKLISYWESEESGHAEAISKYKQALEKCRAMR